MCKYFAKELWLKEPEKLFVCGLLHNLCEPILVELNPEVANKCGSVFSESTPLMLQKNT